MILKRNLLFVLTFIVSACSQFSNAPTSKAWHNLNAKYNALLIAREDYNFAKKLITEKEDYQLTIPILQKPDSTKLDSLKFYLIDAIKKSSLIAERHSNSKFLDEAYLILGKARYEKEEYFNAIETFKYLYTNANTEAYKDAALIQLMATYMANGDLTNASQATDLLKNQPLSSKNKGLFLIHLAHLLDLQKQGEASSVILEEGLKYYPRGLQKARLNFCLAKLYEAQGKQVLARKSFRNVFKNKPSFDLAFNAKIGLLATESLGKNSEQSFSKMMDDRKNQDMKAILYIKMAEIEKRKQNFKQSIKYYSLSNADGSAKNFTKANAHENIADIYFNNLLEYEKAGMHYDSATQFLDQKDKAREQLLSKKQNIFDFIRYKTDLKLEDSLQALSALNPLEIDEILKKEILRKNESQKKMVKSEVPKTENLLKNSNWVFYDQIGQIKAKNEFIRIWGNRSLEDNWRISEKSSGAISIKIVRDKAAEIDTNNVDEENQKLENELMALKKDIPFSELQLMNSKRKQEEALFQIAKIYFVRFKNNEQSKIYFLRLMQDFPKSNYLAESLYSMALMEKSPANSTYGAQLINTFPKSTFTSLLQSTSNGTFDNSKENEVLKAYQSIYFLYEKENYTEALNSLDVTMPKYIGSSMDDKLSFLRIFCLRKLGQKDPYTLALIDFTRAFPNSDLLAEARQLLNAVNK